MLSFRSGVGPGQVSSCPVGQEEPAIVCRSGSPVTGEVGLAPLSSRPAGRGFFGRCYASLADLCSSARLRGVTAVSAVLIAAALSSGCAVSHATRGGIGVPMPPQVGVATGQAAGVQVVDRQIKVDAPQIRAQIASMDQIIRNGGTPVMPMILSRGTGEQIKYGRYEPEVIAEWNVSQLGKEQEMEVIFLLPVSGHVGDTRAEQLKNAEEYARVDRHKLWVVYPDKSEKVIGENIDPRGQFTVAYKAKVRLEKGANTIFFSPLPDVVSPYGFAGGRIIKVNYDGT